MRAIDAIRHALQDAIDWTKPFAEDLRDAPLERSTPHGGNHALWIAGHQAYSEAALLNFANGAPNPYEAWNTTMGAGSESSDDASAYPPYGELLSAMDDAAARTMAYLDTLSDNDLDKPLANAPNEFADFPAFRSVGRLLLFIATHKMSHAGQLADIRKRLGRKPIFG